jgi:hypothetical protein
MTDNLDSNGWPRIHRKCDGFLMIRANGHSRFMSLWEALKYRLFGHIPAFLTEKPHD